MNLQSAIRIWLYPDDSSRKDKASCPLVASIMSSAMGYMSMAAGGSSPPLRSYRDAIAGVAVRPPPPPVSFNTKSFRPMGTLTQDQGMKVLRFSGSVETSLWGRLMFDMYSLGLLLRRITLNFDLSPSGSLTDSPMRVFKWTPTFNPKLESPIIPVWVRLPELPLQFFDQEAIFSIARLLGMLLRTDVSIASLVRPSVAWVCVEVNMLEPLQTEIGFSFETEVVIQLVIYVRLPKYCGVCKHLGHDEIECYEKNKSKVCSCSYSGSREPSG
ncbi:UNVERIFIED_CONTAM: hypothetical protein Sradi_3632100 [Sesamum radiatum]|uniref:DUF4283 domain-containing protein n=1 Tax=Sesamum radiatum TaxID=300843 RepID=A0AAW2QIQ8_SESRA